MADLQISRTVRKGGVLADADTLPVLRDPTNAFGLKRVDTGAIVLAAGTVIPKQSTGVYALTVTGLVAGVSYVYWIETTVGGSTTRQEKTYTAQSGDTPTPLEQAQSILSQLYTAAATADASGIVSTSIDGQSVTFENSVALNSRILFWEKKIALLSGARRRTATIRIS